MKKWIVPLIVVALIIAAAYFYPRSGPSSPDHPSKSDLRVQLERIESDVEQAVREYSPKNPGRIDDLAVTFEPIIKALPGVDKVIVTGPDRPAKRLIHIADWHYVDKDLFKIDMEQAHGKKLSESQVDDIYRDFLLEVEMVQVEQMGLIRCLHHHGLRATFSEGVSVGDEKEYDDRIEAVRGIQKQSDHLRAQLADVRSILKDASGERKKKAEDLQKEIQDAAAGLRIPLQEIGAAGRLLLRGQLERVLPLEDAKLLQEAKPVKDGKIVMDTEKIRRRREAQVKNVFARGPVGVIVLGGSHDLTEQLPKDAEYIRVFMKSYPK
jgi:hypothetical protein